MKISVFTATTVLSSLATSAFAADGHDDHGGAFEWAGAFPMDDDTHNWSMQKVNGAYADPAMRVVFFAHETPDADAIEAVEAAGETLIEGDCPVTNPGSIMGPFTTAGSCYELTVDATADDSIFPMNTAGLKGIVVFAQHVPIEFERDMHYLKDSSGADIEPTAQEGADGHAHDHGHGHGGGSKSTGEPCACTADKNDFKIDCANIAAMTAAFNALKTAGCGGDCSSEACMKNYYIVQSHHDYCPVDIIPSEIEDGFHDFDSQCTGCDIERKMVEGAADCPTPNCSDQSGNEAYAFLVENGCSTGCTTAECKDKYITLKTVHDSCDHEVLSTAAEEGLHDFEDVCPFACNTPGSKKDQLTCPTKATSAPTAGPKSTDAPEAGPDSAGSIAGAGKIVAALVGAAFLI